MPERRKTKKPGTIRLREPAAGAIRPRLLAGANPQIAKAVGDAGAGAVKAYIDAMPDWKRVVGKKLDALIVRTVPGVRKAVKWNTPFYGCGEEVNGWFLGFHCMTRYVKVAFFRGASLVPPPPGPSKQKHVRYLDIYQDDWGKAVNVAQLAAWIKEASRLPGERL